MGLWDLLWTRQYRESLGLLAIMLVIKKTRALLPGDCCPDGRPPAVPRSAVAQGVRAGLEYLLDRLLGNRVIYVA